MSFVIRNGNPEDVPGMFRLIKDLAVFERAPEAVINTEEKLRIDGFGVNPYYRVFVAEDLKSKEIIGMALYYVAYSTWKGRIFYLDDLIVVESRRREGIGRKLLNALLQEARAENISQVRWHVLNWNKPAIDFYKKIGAEFDPEWVTCKMSREQVEEYLKTI